MTNKSGHSRLSRDENTARYNNPIKRSGAAQSIRGLVFFTLLISGSWAIGAEPLGHVANLTGSAKKTGADGIAKPLKSGTELFGDDTVQTAENGSLKIVLKDNSEMDLGPSSNFKFDRPETGKPSMFSLLYGQLRAKVTKATTGDTKLMIKTSSSVMGVRGTDFQTTFNRTTQMSSMVTFEGAVAMARVDAANRPSSSQLLSSLRDSDKSMVVGPGQFSAVSPAQQIPTIPVKISPSQLASMKASSVVGAAAAAAGQPSGATSVASNGKRVISPIPPGVDAKLLAPSPAAIQAAIARSVGTLPATAANPYNLPPPPPPEGMYDAKTGRIAPPAGGFVDTKTGVYVPPPPGSSYDPVAKVFIAPPGSGSFNPSTGAYVPPRGLALTASGTFVSASSPLAQNNGAGTTRSRRGGGQLGSQGAQGQGGVAGQGGTVGQGATPGPSETAGPGATAGGANPAGGAAAGAAPAGGGGLASLFAGASVDAFGAGMTAPPPPPGTAPGAVSTGPMGTVVAMNSFTAVGANGAPASNGPQPTTTPPPPTPATQVPQACGGGPCNPPPPSSALTCPPLCTVLGSAPPPSTAAQGPVSSTVTFNIH